MASSTELLVSKLTEAPDVMNLPWADEGERWSELIFCLLITVREIGAADTRQAIAVMSSLDLIAPHRLASMEATERAIFERALSTAGWTEAEIAAGTELVVHAASVVARIFGIPQLMLRRAAESMRDILVEDLSDGAPAGTDIRTAVGHWLQNTCNLPISVRDKEIDRFARVHGLTAGELTAAADELDLNLAVLDDVIREASGE